MSTILNSISEILKMLVDTFKVAAIFPAFIFVILNQIFIFPHLDNHPLFSGSTALQAENNSWVIVISVLLLGYTLSALEVPIIQLYEGYTWRNTFLGVYLTKRKQKRFTDLNQNIKEKTKELSHYHHFEPSQTIEIEKIEAQINFWQSELSHYYPPNRNRILPTRIGNVIAAFESYPKSRYGMDGVTFWPRMFPIMAKEDFLIYVIESRTRMMFLLNVSVLLFLLGLQSLLLRIFLLPDLSWVIALSAFLGGWFFYQVAIPNAHGWGEMFKVGFDLFRYHLAHALGLKITSSLKKENEQWEELNQFWQVSDSFAGFRHTEQVWPIKLEKGEK